MIVLSRSAKRYFALTFFLAAGAAHATNAVVTTCTETGFTNALSSVDGSGGGTVTFSCGSAATTIPFTSYKLISGNDVIDGANKITFDGGGTSAFFQVFNNESLVLKNLKLQHGVFNAVHALENFGTLTLSGATVTNNASSEAAIVSDGSLIVASSTFSNNTITSGSAEPQGAAIRVDGGTAQISNSTFTANAANAGSSSLGGAIYNDGGDVQISQATFTGNNVNNGASGLGGAIFNNAGTLAIDSSTFSGNKSFDGGALNMRAGSVKVKGSGFSSNVGGYGGAIENDGATLYITTSTFTNNSATGDGGAFWNLFGSGAVDSSQFTGNTSSSTGGAISCYGDTLTVTNSAFANNQSATTGGGIFSECALTVTNTTLSANIANGSGGGGIYQFSNKSALVTFATIAGNSSTFGGGVYNDDSAGGTLTLSKSIIAANPGGNCDGSVDSSGYNLANDMGCGGAFISTDKSNANLPLGAFANNGGPTFTRLPTTGNQAINFVPTAQCAEDRDQRNAGRPSGAGCDSGAVEVNGVFDGIFADNFEH